MTTAAKSGDTVAVHYTGTLADGTVFDSSREREPIQLVLGQGRVIPGFEKALMGMTTGETKTTTIPATEAYGEHRPDMVVEFGRDKVPPDSNASVGQQYQVQTSAGQTLVARVVKTSDDAITLDANHPLAGKELTFEIELVDVVSG